MFEMVVHDDEGQNSITKVAQSGQGSAKLNFHLYREAAIMEEFIADEVESILYIAREVSGMPYALPYDAPMRERSSIQDPTFEGE
jgi:hypothetical protein